jgi:Zn-dependent protease with chaperone function
VDERAWDDLVRRLEQRARENPAGYKAGVVRFVALGYAYLAFGLAVLLALGGFVVWLVIQHPGPLIKLLIPIAAVTWIVLRSLAVRIDPPDGIPIDRTDAPELFRMLDETNRFVAGPDVHAVLVDAELNASVVQRPRAAGLLGSENYLVLGLPLLQALSAGEFRAVLAHELAHLSHAHGRFGAQIYRIRATWWQLLEALEQKRSWGTVLFRRFFAWYVPRFNARTFPLMRMHELEADRLAATAAGAGALASALGRLAVADRFLDTDYWPGVYAGTAEVPEPPEAAFAPLANRLRDPLPEARLRLGQALAAEADTADTHPAFVERLRALDVDPGGLDLERGPEDTAAARYLGDAEARITARLDAEWHAAVRAPWREEFERAEQGRKRLAELDAREHLDDDELVELAWLAADYGSPDEAFARAQAVLERIPDHGGAHLTVGSRLLEQGDDAGLEHLERAMAADATVVLPACAVAAAYLEERGRVAEAERYRERADRQTEVYAAAAEERESVADEDELEPPNLPPEVLDRLRERLESNPDVARAYVVRKRVEHLADELPLYVVGVIPRHEWRQLWREADDDKVSLAEQLVEQIELPGDFQVVVPGPRSAMKTRLEAIDGAEVFSRD